MRDKAWAPTTDPRLAVNPVVVVMIAPSVAAASLVRLLDVQGQLVGIGEHRDSGDTHVACRPDQPPRDLAAIGDQ